MIHTPRKSRRKYKVIKEKYAIYSDISYLRSLSLVELRLLSLGMEDTQGILEKIIKEKVSGN